MNCWAPGVRHALDVKYGLTRFRAFELFHVVSTEPDILRKYEQDMELQMQQVQQSLTAYASRQRSAQSAKEIKDLIAHSLAEMNGGSQAEAASGASQQWFELCGGFGLIAERIRGINQIVHIPIG